MKKMKVKENNRGERNNTFLLSFIIVTIAIVVAAVVSAVVLTMPKDSAEPEHGRTDPLVYYATQEEFDAAGVSETPLSEKGGWLYVGADSEVTLGEGMEIGGYSATLGGAVYVASGGTFTLDGGTICFNSATLGGAIFAEAGATVNLTSGKILGNESNGVLNGYDEYVSATIYAHEDATVNGLDENDDIIFGGNIVNNYSSCDPSEFDEEPDIHYYACYVDDKIYSIMDDSPECCTNAAGYIYWVNYRYLTDLIYDRSYSVYRTSNNQYWDINLPSKVPIDDYSCCGWFKDANMSHGVNYNSSIASLCSELQTVTMYGKTLYKIYTKRATTGGLDFGDTFDHGVSQNTGDKPSGEVVVPRRYEYSKYNWTTTTTIAAGAFADNSNITKVYLPATVENIKKHAFSNCSSLEYINIPEWLEAIGERAFRGANLKMTSLVLPNTIVDSANGNSKIGKYAFYNAFSSSVAGVSLTLSSGLKTIESGVFRNCRLTSVDFNGAQITKIKNQSFEDNLLTSLSLPSTLVSIYDHAFDYNNISSSFRLPSSVHDVGTGAFDYQGSRSDINANGLYVQYGNAYYLGREDVFGDDSDLPLKPDSEWDYIGGNLYFNPYYFLVDIASSGNININPYTKFMSKETIYKMKDRTITQSFTGDDFVDLTQELYGSLGGIALYNNYTLTYVAYDFKDTGDGEAKLRLSSATNNGITKYIYVPSFCASYIYGCFNGFDLRGLCMPSIFGRLGSLFKIGSVSTDNSEVPANFKSLTLIRSTESDSAIIDAYICKDCDALEYVILRDDFSRVEEYAFCNCGSLKAVYIGGDFSILEGAFASDHRNGTLAFDIYYYGTIDSWAVKGFGKWMVPRDPEYWDAYWFLNVRDQYGNFNRVYDAVISVNSISSYAFQRCAFNTVTVENTSRLKLNAGAFYGSLLTRFDYNWSKKGIFNTDCFYNCIDLKALIISSESDIGNTILAKCYSLEYVYIASGISSNSLRSLNENGNAICAGSGGDSGPKFYMGASGKLSAWNNYWNDYSHFDTRGNRKTATTTWNTTQSWFLYYIYEPLFS